MAHMMIGIGTKLAPLVFADQNWQGIAGCETITPGKGGCMRGRTAAAVLIVMTVTVTSVTAQQPCNPQKCAERAGDYFGGDGKPLTWRSSQHVVAPPRGSFPELRCFERTVRNASAESVTLIHWEIARYFRNLIPPGQAACDTMVVDGSIYTPTPTGPLYWGPGRAQYSTQVYAPKVWPSLSVLRWGPEIPYSADWPKEPTVLSSGLMVFPQAAVPSGSVVELKSDVTFLGKEYVYTYTVSHDSPGQLWVKWAVVMDEGVNVRDTQRDFILGGDPIGVAPQRTIIFRHVSPKAPKLGIGTVTILDGNGTELARGLASSFGPSTGIVRE
jgi:hypothetical protein